MKVSPLYFTVLAFLSTHTHLHNVVSRFDVCDVEPLAVDVMAVQVPAAHSDALITEVGALIPLRNT